MLAGRGGGNKLMTARQIHYMNLLAARHCEILPGNFLLPQSDPSAMTRGEASRWITQVINEHPEERERRPEGASASLLA